MYTIFCDCYEAHPELKEFFLCTKLFNLLSSLEIKSAAHYLDEELDSPLAITGDEMASFFSIAFMHGEDNE